MYARWLVDSEKYNEWMAEQDYETEEALAEQEAKRKADGGAGVEEEEPGAIGMAPLPKRVSGLGGEMGCVSPCGVLR